MIIDKTKFTARNGYLEAAGKSVPAEFPETAKLYKRKVAGNFLLVDGAKIAEKLGGNDFCATRKLDGEMQIVFVRGDEVFMSGSGGKIRVGLPCLEACAEAIRSAGYRSASVVAELHVLGKDGKRTRVSDVARALGDETAASTLALAVFDILDLDGEKFTADHYSQKHEKICEIFPSVGDKVFPVEAKKASGKDAVRAIFEAWVGGEDAEGLVVHNETPIIYKIKPRHTIDAVVIGYTVGEGENCGKIRDILVAVLREDGSIQQFGATGNGFSEEQKSTLCEKLSSMGVESEYIETDSRNVAFRMVKPELVVELSATDFISENASGGTKFNKLLSYSDEGGYKASGSVPGVSVISLVFERIREDKSADPADARVSQLSDLCPFAEVKSRVCDKNARSEILVRKVYTKGNGKKFMVQKFVVWKTNKEASGMFPAYILHHTDYSCGRKDALKRDIRVSSSEEQIMKFLDEFLAENIKKGWDAVQ